MSIELYGLYLSGSVGTEHDEVSTSFTMDDFILNQLSLLQLHAVTIYENNEQEIVDILFDYRWKPTELEFQQRMFTYDAYAGFYCIQFANENIGYLVLKENTIKLVLYETEYTNIHFEWDGTLLIIIQHEKILGELYFNKRSHHVSGIDSFYGWILCIYNIHGWMTNPLTSTASCGSTDGSRSYDTQYCFVLAPNEYIVTIMSVSKYKNLQEVHVLSHLQFHTNLNRIIGQDELATSPPSGCAYSTAISRTSLTYFEGQCTSYGLVYLSAYSHSKWFYLRWLILLRVLYQEEKAQTVPFSRRMKQSNRVAYKTQKMMIQMFRMSHPLFNRICQYL